MEEESADAPIIVTSLVETKPVQSLAILASDIARCKPPEWPHHFAISAFVSFATRMAPIFEDIKSSLPLSDDGHEALSKTGAVCIKEAFVVLKWGRSLIELCSTGSRIAALLLADAHSDEFRTLVGELAEVLGLFPWRSLAFVEDAKSKEAEMNQIKEDCEKVNGFVEQKDLDLRKKIIADIEELVKDFFPVREEARRLLDAIGVIGFEAQVKEIKLLEQELAACTNLTGPAKTAAEFARYCKFVLFGKSWPDSRTYERCPREDWVFPPAAKCPITGAVMRDPVLLSTGAMYDRANIHRWLDAGNKSCPATGKAIHGTRESYMTSVPAIRELIDEWIKKTGIKLRVTEKITKQMRAAYLVEMLSLTDASPALAQAACRVVQDIAATAEGSKEWRLVIGGEMPFEVLLRQVERQGDDERRELAMKVVGILARERANLKRIAGLDNGLSLILASVGSGQPWGLRGEAAEVVYWLSTVPEYRAKMLAAGEDRPVVRDLQEVMRDGPAAARKGAMAGIIGVGSQKEKEVEVRFLLNRWDHGEQAAVAGLVAQEPVRSLVEKMGQKFWTKLGRQCSRLLDVWMTWKETRPAKPTPRPRPRPIEMPSKNKIVPVVDDDGKDEITSDLKDDIASDIKDEVTLDPKDEIALDIKDEITLDSN